MQINTRTLLASVGVDWSGDFTIAFGSRVASIPMLFFVAVLSVVAELLARQWARLSQMPK
jgi:hypothetical protein